MPAGRPTTYDPAYCERVVAHMADGASLTSFAAEVDCDRSTINAWMEAHPEFSQAVKAGKAKCATWWEKQTRKIATEGGASCQATLCIFGLKNMGAEDWQEKQSLEHSGPGGVPIQPIVQIYLPDNARDNRNPPAVGPAGKIPSQLG